MQSSNYYQTPQPQQQYIMQPSVVDNSAAPSGVEEDDSDGSGIPDKRSGRRKIKIEYINDKSRRHITFSKRKAGIMKKAYELSTLTGTQILLLVVSETGLVYTFTTPKLQPLVTKPEGKNLIQSCLNAPDQVDSSGMEHHPSQQQQSRSTMSTSNTTTSPPTTSNTNYFRPNQSVDSNNSNYVDDRKSFANIVATNPPLVLSTNNNRTITNDPQLTSSYNPMTYASYGSNNPSNTNQSSATAQSTNVQPLYSYNLSAQADENTRYWNSSSINKHPDTSKR